MDVNHGITSNNQRIAVLKRWLSKPPLRASVCRLIAVGEPQLQLGEWTREELVPGLAHEVDALAEDHARESGLAECRFMLAFVDEQGGALLTKPMTVRRAPAEDSAVSVAQQLDGSATSWNIQMQRHTEAMVRMFLTGQQAQVQALISIIGTLSERVVDSEHRVDSARETANALRELLSEASQAEGAQENAEPSPQRERLYKLVADNLPAILLRMAAPQ